MLSYQDYYNGITGQQDRDRNRVDPEMLRLMLQQSGGVIGRQHYRQGMLGQLGRGPAIGSSGGGVGGIGSLPTYGRAPTPPRFLRSQRGMQAPNYGRPPAYQQNLNRPMYQNTSFLQPAQLPAYGGGGGNYSNTSFLQPARVPLPGTLDPNRFTAF